MTLLPSWKDKALFTPGPLTTSQKVKQAMQRDLGSRDTEFVAVIQEVRRRLVELCADPREYTAVLMQGSGTFGIEATLSSVVPPDGKLLILVNGAYGNRMAKIAAIHHIPSVELVFPEDTQPEASALESALESDDAITHVAVVHCETTTGIINPIKKYGEIAKEYDCVYIVDAMSSFGAYPIDLRACGIDYLISSSNKCIEGVPGFSFVLARKLALTATRGFARTLSLDLLAQWEGLEGDGQFRFTPPTHAILAFHQALLELEQEGGIEARGARYRQNHDITMEAMLAMGFRPYLEESRRGYIITSFYYPRDPNFSFQTFYEHLSEKGYIIYPGKLSHADCFRIGHIGRLAAGDVKALMAAVAETLEEMHVDLVKVPVGWKMEFIFNRSYRGPVKAVVLDWAGTAVDYGSFAPTAVFLRLFESRNVTITAEDARSGMGLMKKDHLRTILSQPAVAAAWQAAHGALVSEDDINELFADFVPMQLKVLKEYADPIPGLLDVVAELKVRGIKVGSTTGYIRSMMDILAPEAAARGYAPDCIVCPDDVPAGRPYPWMCYQNAMQLGVYPMSTMVKVGDTLVDIEEGLNAGMWSVGISLAGNLMGLTEAEVTALSTEERDMARSANEAQLYRAGAHYVIDGIWDLPGVLDAIEARLIHGERP